MAKKIFLFIAFIFAVLFIYFLIKVPDNFHPAKFIPQAAQGLTGVWQPNERLKKAQLLAKGFLNGPESVSEDAKGEVYTGLADGRIVRFPVNSPNIRPTTFVNTQGRPLGLSFDKSGNLIVADAIKGLLSISPQGKITTLVTEAGGIPLKFTDDLAMASNGKIYFSDASSKYGIKNYRLDILEARPWGRLLEYDPSTKTVRTLLKNLYFANGVALSKNEDFVLVNETSRYRITRYWLKGKKAGTSDIFINNLPGFPDNISSNKKGIFWLALPTLRNASLDAMEPYPLLKELALLLPEALQPQPQPYGLVAALNEKGKVLFTLQDTNGKHLSEITDVRQIKNYIFTGSLHGDRIGKLMVPPQAR